MNPIKLTEPGKVIAYVLTVATTGTVIYGSFPLRDVFATLYGENPDLPFITSMALTAYIWAPIILGLAVIAFHRTAKRMPESKRPYIVLLCLEMIIVGLVFYGTISPLRTTTFQMSKPSVSTPAPKTP